MITSASSLIRSRPPGAVSSRERISYCAWDRPASCLSCCSMARSSRWLTSRKASQAAISASSSQGAPSATSPAYGECSLNLNCYRRQAEGQRQEERDAERAPGGARDPGSSHPHGGRGHG